MYIIVYISAFIQDRRLDYFVRISYTNERSLTVGLSVCQFEQE